LAGHDAAVGSVRFPTPDPAKLIGAASDSKVGRYLVVGRTGSLDLTRPRRRRARPFWNLVVPQKQLNWTFLSTVGAFGGGRANSKVPARNGTAFDRDKRQKPAFYEDFAVAQAGEMERPVHIRQRSTVGHLSQQGGPGGAAPPAGVISPGKF
jgi:hypothetical protein